MARQVNCQPSFCWEDS